MHNFNAVLLIFGGVSLLLGLTSGLVKNRFYISEPIIAVLVGIAVGPALGGLVDLQAWGDPVLIVTEASRLTLAVALMTAALQLPDHFFFRHGPTLAVLLGIIMPLMCLAGGLLAYCFLDVSLLTALLLGAVICPTDPVLSSSIVTGKIAVSRLPADLRYTLIAESGANDALAYPLVMLPILIHHLGWQAAAVHWAWETIFWQVVGSSAFGAAVGYAAQCLLNRIRKSADAELGTLQTVSISLAVTVAGGVKLLHGEGLLAVFVAGLFLNRAISGEFNIAKQELNENLKRFLDIPVFILFGMVLPWRAWIDLGPAGLGLAAAVLLLRRLPAVMLLRPFLRSIRTRHEAAFLGWFGPIGIAALYYAHVALGKGEDAIVWEAGSLIIFASLIVHGASATPLTHLLGRRQGRAGGGADRGTSGSPPQ